MMGHEFFASCFVVFGYYDQELSSIHPEYFLLIPIIISIYSFIPFLIIFAADCLLLIFDMVHLVFFTLILLRVLVD